MMMIASNKKSHSTMRNQEMINNRGTILRQDNNNSARNELTSSKTSSSTYNIKSRSSITEQIKSIPEVPLYQAADDKENIHDFEVGADTLSHRIKFYNNNNSGDYGGSKSNLSMLSLANYSLSNTEVRKYDSYHRKNEELKEKIKKSFMITRQNLIVLNENNVSESVLTSKSSRVNLGLGAHITTERTKEQPYTDLNSTINSLKHSIEMLKTSKLNNPYAKTKRQTESSCEKLNQSMAGKIVNQSYKLSDASRFEDRHNISTNDDNKSFRVNSLVKLIKAEKKRSVEKKVYIDQPKADAFPSFLKANIKSRINVNDNERSKFQRTSSHAKIEYDKLRNSGRSISSNRYSNMNYYDIGYINDSDSSDEYNLENKSFKKNNRIENERPTKKISQERYNHVKIFDIIKNLEKKKKNE